jgi:hypothetical protein
MFFLPSFLPAFLSFYVYICQRNEVAHTEACFDHLPHCLHARQKLFETCCFIALTDVYIKRKKGGKEGRQKEHAKYTTE